MEAQYHILATILAAACPSGFDRAWIEADVEDGYVDAQYWYEKNGATINPSIASAESFRIARALLEVRKAWPGQPFDQGTFTLSGDGTFKLDVRYNDN